MLTAILLLAWPRYAHAQNSSTAPYINSWHLYRVEMGNTANTVTWELYDNLGEAADHTLSGTGAWWDAAIVGDNAEIEIKFTNTEFASGQTWYLVYTETNIATGTCEARRIAPDILITDNEFFLSTNTNNPESCNAWSGLVWDNALDITDNYSQAVTFHVDMTKAELHAVSEWSFHAEVTVSASHSIPAANVFIPEVAGSRTGNSTYGTYTISNISGGEFDVAVEPDLSNPLYTNGDAVEFTVYISGQIVADVTATLTIDNGQAVSGTNYDVITDDNGSGDHDQEQTLLAIPATPVIAVVE